MSGPTTPIAERLATAAELQDLLAHRIAVIAVQAAAAAQSVDPRQAPLHGSLSSIATLSADAMADLRRLARVLDLGGPVAYRPQPSLAALPALPVELDLGGVADADVGETVALCAYRAVELVADDCRARDVPPPAVALRLESGRLTLTFEFGSGGGSSERTAARLRERLRPCGGVLRAAPQRWQARLPLEA
ncbi:MAG TPA: histidine kinase [Capillimicrobium sp.]|nr:histidine kinase [Capillimicrobium sp.]